MIPISDPKRQIKGIQKEIEDKVKEVIQSGNYILGENVMKLEAEIKKKLNVTDAVAVASGTDALTLTLRACDIGRGDEVITTPFTFFATAEAIVNVGATPVFVDVDEGTYNIQAKEIESKITNETKAIMPVHLFGRPAEMDEIKRLAEKYNLHVIEDACQAFGATYKGKKVGGIGDAGCFSFFPTKNLFTVGDGGIVTTMDQTLADRIRMLRTHGSIQKYIHEEVGYNSRLDEIHAGILLVSLKHIDQWNDLRRKLANRYHHYLQTSPFLHLPTKPDENDHVYHLFSMRVKHRDALGTFLKRHHISTGVYYPLPLHLQRAFTFLDYVKGDYPIAEKLAEELISIPIFPYLTRDEQDKVIHRLKQFQVHES